MAEEKKIKKIAGANMDPNDEWALLKKWEREALKKIKKDSKREKKVDDVRKAMK